MSHQVERYSWGAEFPERCFPFVLGTDRWIDLAVQVEARAVPESLDRFRLEHRSSASLCHPGLLQDFQLVEEPERVLLFSQQFPGQKLSEVLTEEPLTPARCLEIFIPLAQAVNYVSSHSSVHRLISPQTIWVHRGQFKLQGVGWAFVDFYAPHTDESRSRWSESLAHLSPEQVRGERATNWSDQFSLGVLLYRLASGRLPFPSKSVKGVVDQILQVVPGLDCIPSGLRPVVERCLHKQAEKRFPSMQALLAEFGIEPDSNFERGAVLMSAATERVAAGRPEEGLELLEEALAANPYDALIHGHLGVRMSELGRLDQAYGYYRRAIELQPYEPRLRYILGHHELTQGNLECAAGQFRCVLAVDPDFALSPEEFSLCE